ncbi:MAG: lipopolysaccharide kinase InaA family protein, partial [Phycisphaerae bacterium]
VLKYSKTSQVCQATLPDPGLACAVIAKQSRPDSFRQHLRRWLGPSRAQRGFEQALRLLACSIPTAAPLAVVDRCGRRAESWLVTQAIPDPVDLDNIALALLPRTPPHAWRRIKNVLIQRIVELFVRLEEHRLAHRDLKASNLLFTDWDSQGDEPRLWVVDLDGLSAGKPGRRWQPHVRLAASLAEYPTITRTDCARLLKQHLARTTVAGPTLWKSVWPTLAPRVADYVRAARARKIHKLDGEG